MALFSIRSTDRIHSIVLYNCTLYLADPVQDEVQSFVANSRQLYTVDGYTALFDLTAGNDDRYIAGKPRGHSAVDGRSTVNFTPYKLWTGIGFQKIPQSTNRRLKKFVGFVHFRRFATSLSELMFFSLESAIVLRRRLAGRIVRQCIRRVPSQLRSRIALCSMQVIRVIYEVL